MFFVYIWRLLNASFIKLTSSRYETYKRWTSGLLWFKKMWQLFLQNRSAYGLPGLNFSLNTQSSSNCVNWPEDLALVLAISCSLQFSIEYPAWNWIEIIVCNCYITNILHATGITYKFLRLWNPSLRTRTHKNANTNSKTTVYVMQHTWYFPSECPKKSHLWLVLFCVIGLRGSQVIYECVY